MTQDKAILVIGAGDATGGVVARRFAREGYVARVTRRNADKLQPLVQQIQADGGRAHAFGSDARKEDEMVALVERIERDIARPSRWRCSTSAPTCASASTRPARACTTRSGRWPASPVS